MDSIKKKMQSLSSETANATVRANKYETEIRRANDIAEGFEEQVRNIQKKMQVSQIMRCKMCVLNSCSYVIFFLIQTLEGQYDVCTESVFDVTLKLEGKEKSYASADADVGGLSRRLLLLEDEVEKSEERLAKAITGLCKESWRADHAVRNRQRLENSNQSHEEQSDQLESQLKEVVNENCP